jgi:hypothetical protein
MENVGTRIYSALCVFFERFRIILIFPKPEFQVFVIQYKFFNYVPVNSLLQSLSLTYQILNNHERDNANNL